MIEKLTKYFLYALSLTLRFFLKVKKGRVLCLAYYKKNYSCNPKYISEYLLENHSNKFEIFWVFDKCIDTKEVNPKANIVIYPSLKYMLVINTAEFIINNCRMDNKRMLWTKSSKQKYIQTWHGSLGIKKCEGCSELPLPDEYVRLAKKDSQLADLFISGSDFMTNCYHKYYWYSGEVLQKGFPRNDVFFNKETLNICRQEVEKYYGIPRNHKIVLYSPTFRDDYSLDYYRIDWKQILPSLETLYESPITVLIRLHPNFVRKNIDTSSLLTLNNVLDATRYYDMQPLAIAADMMITDYSSCMFDVAYMKKPCFLYAVDADTYDRGTFYNLNELPFPFASNNEQLNENIRTFNYENYLRDLRYFMADELGSIDNGTACESLYQWMIEHSIK